MQAFENFKGGELSPHSKQLPGGERGYVTGSTGDALASVLGDKKYDGTNDIIFDISFHKVIVLVIENTHATRSLDYSVQVSPNPLHPTPIWQPIAAAAVAGLATAKVELSMAGLAMRVQLKSTTGGQPATFRIHGRMYPH